MLRQLSTSTAMSLVGALWFVNFLNLCVTVAAAAFSEVLHLPVLVCGFCVVFFSFFNMAAKITRND